MKLRTKDEIITCLIDSLSQDVENTKIHEDYIHDGWIEALKWVLGLNDKEIYNKGKNTLVVKEKNEPLIPDWTLKNKE